MSTNLNSISAVNNGSNFTPTPETPTPETPNDPNKYVSTKEKVVQIAILVAQIALGIAAISAPIAIGAFGLGLGYLGGALLGVTAVPLIWGAAWLAFCWLDEKTQGRGYFKIEYSHSSSGRYSAEMGWVG